MRAAARVNDRRAPRRGAHDAHPSRSRERGRATCATDEKPLTVTASVTAVVEDDDLRDRQFAAIVELLRMAVELRSAQRRKRRKGV
jgi:hypothetical protein